MALATSITPLLALLWLQFGDTPLWFIIFLFLLIVAMFWWGLTRGGIGQEKSADAHGHSDDHDAHGEESHGETAVAEAPSATRLPGELVESVAAAEAATETAVPDDLKIIEGIGPKIESLLNAADITTYAQLAALDLSRLHEIVVEKGGIHISDPATWPEQAQLAAADDWDALEKLQEELVGGRRE